jgi:hypothetical protein
VNAFEHNRPYLTSEKLVTRRIKPVPASGCHVHVHASKFMISSHQKHAVWKADFQGEQQSDHLYLLRPSVHKIAVEHVRRQFNVSA